MNIVLTVMLLISIGALLCVLAASVQRVLRNRGTKLFANIAEGQYLSGNKTYLADAAITTRFFLVKLGTDSGHVAVCAGAATVDEVIGVCTDESAAAEDPVNVHLLGAGTGTHKMVAGAAITAGAKLMSATNGKVITATTGSNYVIGKALTAAAADGDVIEVISTVPWLYV